jgi:hypothetical protein
VSTATNGRAANSTNYRPTIQVHSPADGRLVGIVSDMSSAEVFAVADRWGRTVRPRRWPATGHLSPACGTPAQARIRWAACTAGRDAQPRSVFKSP